MIADVDGEPSWRCSGTLISQKVFPTAGHCVYGATAARVWFDTDVGEIPDYPYGGEVAIEGTPIPHPDYLWGPGDTHDVGVVILDEPVDGVGAAKLPDAGLLDALKKERILRGGYGDGAYFTLVGYGGVLASWPPPLLDYDLIRRVAESEYVAMSQVYVHLSQKAVFGEEGTCFGDSGGPVFWQDEIIVAVTSTGDAQCLATGLYYRVDTPDILEWIEAQDRD
jgi:V8-like Glu-specific endopeptidase